MTIFTVSDSAGLYEALANATGGDTIELAEGDYGNLVLDAKSGFDITYDTPVTITSADPLAPASFSEMTLNGAANLTFDNVVFDYTYDSSDEIYSSPFYVMNSSDITIRNSLFDGDVASDRSATDDGYGFARGLVVSGSTGVSIENNEFTTWHKMLIMWNSQNIVVSGNDIHSIRSDGMNFVEVQSVLIEDNYIHDFNASPTSGDHLDMIQFWTTGTDAPSTDIIIRNNILDIGDGDWTQSIFMRNEVVDQGLAGSEMFYQNILIEGNVILNGHGHGITVGETDGLTIRNNSVLSIDVSDEHFNSTPKINVASASTSVVIEYNAVSAITGYDNDASWSLSNNAYIQNTDPNAPGYYADLFLESSVERGDTIWSYVVAPGSMIENLSAGASRLLLDITPDTVTPHFDVTSSTDTAQTLVFDATHTYGPTGQIMSDGATFIWDFGDGTTATGQVVKHSYITAGNYDVTLQVLLDGQDVAMTATAYAEVNIAGDDVLAFNASDGAFYLQGYGAETVIDNSDAASVLGGEGMVVNLGGPDTVVGISKEALSRFFGSDAFEMSMTLQADQPGASWGEVARIHMSIIVSVQGDGNLNVRLWSDTGEDISLTSQGILVNDGAAHNISIVFDGTSDSLQILIDGAVAASETVTGSMPGMGYWGLVFGEPSGGQNFDGTLSAFELDATFMDYSAFEGVLEAPEPAPEPVPERAPEPVPEPAPEPAPGDNSDEGALPILDDYVTEFAQLTAGQLHDDAYVETTESGSSVHLDGARDYVNIGRLTQFETTDQLSFFVDFSKHDQSTEEQRLVWNNKKVGLSVEGDSLKIYVGQVDKGFNKAIIIDDLGLDDTESHQVIVMIDGSTDRLQVILDGVLVLDMQQGMDIEFSGGRQQGWQFGSARKHSFDGEIHDFRIDASAEFVSENFLVPDDASLMG